MESIIAGIFGLLIGIAGLWTGFHHLRNRAAVSTWGTTKGKVIERGTFQPETAFSVQAFRYAPLIKYAYQVNGKEFVNDCIHPKRIQMPEHSSKKWAEKRAKSFADDVVVHYNPLDPHESFLVLTPKSKLYIVLGCSCVALMFGALFLLSKLTG